MAYFIDLFSPETYEAFGRSSRDISGFRLRHKRAADRVSLGDRFVCYLTGVAIYYEMAGKHVIVPDKDAFRPSSAALLWHAENVYR